MASYSRLKKQLETLQAQVETARQAELLPIIKRMQREMATHGISAADLGAVSDPVKGAAKKVAGTKSAKRAGAPKYKDPKSGLTWSGFGRAPHWIASKRDRTKFLIDTGTASKGASSKVATAATESRICFEEGHCYEVGRQECRRAGEGSCWSQACEGDHKERDHRHRGEGNS